MTHAQRRGTERKLRRNYLLFASVYTVYLRQGHVITGYFRKRIFIKCKYINNLCVTAVSHVYLWNKLNEKLFYILLINDLKRWFIYSVWFSCFAFAWRLSIKNEILKKSNTLFSKIVDISGNHAMYMYIWTHFIQYNLIHNGV